MTPEWLSAHLDGELTAGESAEVEAALAADPALAAEFEDLRRVRNTLRAAMVEPPEQAIDRIVAAVAADDDAAGAVVAADDDADDDAAGEAVPAPVVALRSRRRAPSFAAVAASVAIIASVVGGIGVAGSVPAIGELVAQHEVAAAVIEGAPMPDDMAMDELPMDDAMAVAPAMPDEMAMARAFVHGSTVHLVYLTPDGEPISVFRHEGDADVDALGPGTVVEGDDVEMWSAPYRDAYVVVIDGTGYVWVVVSEQPHDSMMDDMMHDLPSRTPSLGDRIRGVADAVAEPFRFWD